MLGPLNHCWGGPFERPCTRVGSSTKRKTFPKPFNRHFCLKKNNVSVSEDQTRLTHFFPPCDLWAISESCKSPFDRSGMWKWALSSCVIFFANIQCCAIVSNLETLKCLYVYNCDTFLTCYFWKMSKRFVVVYKIFSYCH